MADFDLETFNSSEEWHERGYHLRVPPVVIIAYDPAGDGDDDDGLVMIAREEHQKGETYDPDFAVAMKFRVLAAQIMPKHLEFPDKLARLLAVHRQMVMWSEHNRCWAHFFAVESNGVGWGLSSALRSKIGAQVISYTTVANATDKPHVDGRISMPRLASLDNLRVIAETHHLKIAPDAPGKTLLTGQLASFVWRRPGRPEAMKGQKDDLVMALAGGVWIGSKIVGPILKATSFKRASRVRRVS